ncbi:unnamed protein product [Lactuca saligna]|uniref:Uncharacterized protein n=1 Tax=Lactuca saligna TaxID=75948 RepID=A0AA35UZM8_LACSI|nr:unnamed protein product [Lactuca saligna]
MCLFVPAHDDQRWKLKEPVGYSITRTDDVRIFLATWIEVWKTSDLSPKLYFGHALELSQLITTDIGVVSIVCSQDSVKGVVCELVLLTLESKGEHPHRVILCISGKELKCKVLVCAHRKS